MVAFPNVLLSPDPNNAQIILFPNGSGLSDDLNSGDAEKPGQVSSLLPSDISHRALALRPIEE